MRRLALAALFVTAAITAAPATASGPVVRWDIVQLIGIPPSFDQGGFAVAYASDDSAMTVTGTGTFVAPLPPAEPTAASSVAGGGSWEITDQLGFPIGSGTYEVTAVLAWVEGGAANLPPFIEDRIGDPADITEGLLHLAISYDDGSSGVLVVSAVGGPGPAPLPPAGFRGVTVSKDEIGFFLPGEPDPANMLNFTLIHVTETLGVSELGSALRAR